MSLQTENDFEENGKSNKEGNLVKQKNALRSQHFGGLTSGINLCTYIDCCWGIAPQARKFHQTYQYLPIQYSPPMLFRRTDEDQMRLGDNWDSEPPENSPHSSLVMGSRRGMVLNVLQNLLDGVTKGLNGVANVIDYTYKGPGAYPYHHHHP